MTKKWKCPVHRVSRYMAAGVSKRGRAYPPFFSCPVRGCGLTSSRTKGVAPRGLVDYQDTPGADGRMTKTIRNIPGSGGGRFVQTMTGTDGPITRRWVTPTG